MINMAVGLLTLIHGIADAVTMIHDIQGNGASSPIVGFPVVIEGIVVADFQESGQLGGFFVQEEDRDVDTDPLTSEGIYVYDAVDTVAVGDLVEVSGMVSEYYGLTEIISVTQTIVKGSGIQLPTAVGISLPLGAADYAERYESMLVTFSQHLIVNETYYLGRYGEITLSSGRLFQYTHANVPNVAGYSIYKDTLALKKIILDDGKTAQNPDPVTYPGFMLAASNTLRNGYVIDNLTGVMGYGRGEYRVYATENVIFSTMTNSRTTTPNVVGGTLKVASFNVLNYFSTLDTSSFICGPLADQSCRGADSASEFTRQRDKILDTILDIDADIVGLVEIENHAADKTLDDLIAGLNSIYGFGIYVKVDTIDSIGSDAIKVALIYKPSTVTIVGSYAILDSSVDPAFNDSKNRPALAQTFRETATGEKLTVIVNHLKSKGSDCEDVGDPDLNDGQGNCNVTRTSAMTALVKWLNNDPTQSSDTDYLIIGDLNSYAMEYPITVLKDAGYVDLLNKYRGDAAYSYVYYGEAGYLDHALASASLATQVTGVSDWHINSDEPLILDYNEEYKSAGQLTDLYHPDQYRASDHDPVIIGLDLIPVCDKLLFHTTNCNSRQ